MPDPIRASSNVCDFNSVDGASAEETHGQVSLSAAHPVIAPSASPAVPNEAQAASPAVNQLITRFVKPTVVHPPVEPSLAKALGNCEFEAGMYAATVGTTLALAPESFGVSFLVGAVKIVGTSAALARCIDKEETAQIEAAKKANQAADCQAQGGVPVTMNDGSLLCAVTE